MYMLLILLLLIPQLAFAWTYYEVSRQPVLTHTWERVPETQPLPVVSRLPAVKYRAGVLLRAYNNGRVVEDARTRSY